MWAAFDTETVPEVSSIFKHHPFAFSHLLKGSAEPTRRAGLLDDAVHQVLIWEVHHVAKMKFLEEEACSFFRLAHILDS